MGRRQDHVEGDPLYILGRADCNLQVGVGGAKKFLFYVLAEWVREGSVLQTGRMLVG